MVYNLQVKQLFPEIKQFNVKYRYSTMYQFSQVIR